MTTYVWLLEVITATGVLSTATVEPKYTVCEPITTPGRMLEVPDTVVSRSTGLIATVEEPTGTGAICEISLPAAGWLVE